MKKSIYFLAVLLASVMMSCGNKQSRPVNTSVQSQDTFGAYDEMYKDSFDILIHSRIKSPLTKREYDVHRDVYRIEDNGKRQAICANGNS